MTKLEDKSLVTGTNPQTVPSREVALNSATSRQNDLRENARLDLRDTSSEENLPLRNNSMLIADVDVSRQVRQQDFFRMAGMLANPTSGVGGAAIMVRHLGSAQDWATLPATESFKQNDFYDAIDPKHVCDNLAASIARSSGKLGIDQMYAMALNAVQTGYGTRDTTTAAVVLATVLKRATGSERCRENGWSMEGDLTHRSDYQAVNDHLKDYRGDGVNDNGSLYYHAATIAAIYKGGGAGFSTLAAIVENAEPSGGDDPVKQQANLDMAQALGWKSIINLR